MTDKAWKMLVSVLMWVGCLWIAAVNVQAAEVLSSVTGHNPVAGIDIYMDNYQKDINDLTQEKVKIGTFHTIFQNLGVAMVEDSLNIRKEPKNDGEIIGKLKRHSGASVLSEENGWYKIKSGQITGYVYGQYLATGKEAKNVAYYEMKLMLRVNTDTLRVRSQPNTEAKILGRIHEGETYRFLSEKGGWAKIEYKRRIAFAYVPELATIAYTIPEAERRSDVRTRVVDYAVRFVGKPYRWGGTDPNTGADCSGFVQYVMEHAAGLQLERTSRQQAEEGEAVSASSMEPGDLLFYSSGISIDHVAMYIGKGRIVHAANRKSGIKISSWNYRKPVAIRRVIPYE